MMEDNGQLQMQVGDVVQMPDGLYRVLVMTPNSGIFIQMETTRLNILRFSMDFIKYQVSIGGIKKAEWKDEELLVKYLTDEEKEELNRKTVAIERMLQSLYPEWERIQSKETKPEIKELMQELGRSKAVTHRKIRNYLQSGRNPYSLVDGRKGEKNRKNEYKVGDPVRGHGDKTVANDERLEEIFKDGYSYFLKGKEAGVSLKSAYRYLVGKHYMTQEYSNGTLVQKMAPLEEIPTYKRFWTYCNKQNDRNGIVPLKMSAKERRNNSRLLRGNSQSGCLGPGHIVEVDEVEIDMINVSSRDSRQGVVEDCVNRVGVDLNTASASLLEYISGVSKAIAKNIVAYREENGVFTNRRQLLKVAKLGPKAFEQCAGFMRIKGGDNPLDMTSVHPESYEAVQKLLEKVSCRPQDIAAGGLKELGRKVRSCKGLAEELGIGEITLKDIIKELEKPARDPREEMQKPILRTDVLEMKDLTPGMVLKGTVRNVIDFGAFVDIGVHQDGLVHISQMTDRYIKHPLEAVSVGDIVEVKVLSVDLNKKRIGLTMKL